MGEEKDVLLRVALVPEEPAGKVITRSAGAVEVWASLGWPSVADVPEYSMLPSFPETVKPLLTESGESKATERIVAGELLAFSDQDLSAGVDLLLRTLTTTAAVTDAVLEVRVFRAAAPRVSDGDLVCGLARKLWKDGRYVTFGVSWHPVRESQVALGVGGSSVDLEGFIGVEELWEITPRDT
ncbi:hypothetical protein BH23ACT11_BH23ACT11_05980 [soil metagenome]